MQALLDANDAAGLGIDVNQPNSLGETPLHAAAWGLHTGCVRALLAAAAVNVNLTTFDGQTPLHAAVQER